MTEPLDDAADVLRDALAESADPVRVTLTIPRVIAEKLLLLVEAEHTSGAVVVPVKELYTTTESAAMLGISRASLMKLIESGDIEAVKVGTHHRVPADELVAYQRARQVSRERAAELLTEFSSRSTGFQSNVTFRAAARRLQHALGEGRES
ncbi:helix-turn-helix domain-containing protein [uncultured Microbacterium sp.]|uniref:helix-turn-helix domain-containing protein n=1 Tax=uncultured Microbacterium sp. TaxID=191216 RepID=UPI0025EB41AD|nr:helix-turn-helix domain-containing protein [uncultured Microbacterium sp.]